MEKKGVIIVTCFVIVLAVVIGVLVFGRGTFDNYIVKINDVTYGAEDFTKYFDIYSVENTEAKKSEAFEDFLETKLYYQEAGNKAFVIPSDVTTEAQSSYESADKAVLEEKGISEEEYISYQKESGVVDAFKNDLATYYAMPDSVYDTFLEQNKIYYKTYEYRVMQLGITKNEDGTDDKEAVLEKANGLLEKVKAGEDFEALAKENSSFRITIKDGNYTFVQGGLESVPLILLDQILYDEKVYNAVVAMQEAGYTDIIETDDSYVFVKVENVIDGWTESGTKLVKDILANQYANSMIKDYASIIYNQKKLNELGIEVSE